MEIRLANVDDTNQICSFFSKYLVKRNNAVYPEEYYCLNGVRAAIKRGQIIVAVDGCTIAGAVRYYRKKKCKQISLYQFAVGSDYRGQLLTLSMLETLRNMDIVSICPRDSSINNFFEKTGWVFIDQKGENNRWCLMKNVQ